MDIGESSDNFGKVDPGYVVVLGEEGVVGVVAGNGSASRSRGAGDVLAADMELQRRSILLPDCEASVVAGMGGSADEEEGNSVGQSMPRKEPTSLMAESSGECEEEPRPLCAVKSTANSVQQKRNRGEDGPASSEQSTLRVNPEAPGWTKR